MNARPPGKRLWITNIYFFLAFAAVTARALFSYRDSPDLPFMMSMLAAYLAVLAVEPFAIQKNQALLHGFNTLQTAITLALLMFAGRFDFFAILFVPPCANSILHLPRKIAFAWIGGICLVMVAALFARFPLSESIGYMILYPAAIFLFTGFSYVTVEAEKAQNRSEALLADLQAANEKLKAYAAQVEELAALNERNRLARELHDSVTQIIFGLTLSAQAARILLDRDPSRVAAQLDHMQVLAQNALAEMRTLIQQMRPRTVSEEGLEAALRRLAAEHQVNDSLTVEVAVCGNHRLPPHAEEELYRVTQEALNNIAKHAHTNHAEITLHLEATDHASLVIEDRGSGFDPSAIRAQPGHLGLVSMAERVEALGGSLRIESQPGKGTTIWVELDLEREVDHAG